MTALTDSIKKGKQTMAIVTNYQLIEKARVEHFSNDKMDLTFIKGSEPETGLPVTALLRTEPLFQEAELVSLIDVVRSKKGLRANAALEISRDEYVDLT